MKTSLVALSLLFVSLPAYAGDANEKWVKVQSPHFIVYSNGYEDKARLVASHYEQMRVVFQMLFPNIPESKSTPMVVVALKDIDSTKAILPDYLTGKDVMAFSCVYVNNNDKSYALIDLFTSTYIWDLINYDVQSHQKLDEGVSYFGYSEYRMQHERYLPFWLRQGLSTFYSESEITDELVWIGNSDPYYISLLRDLIQLTPIRQLIQTKGLDPTYKKSHEYEVFTAETWALTHYLIFSDIHEKTHHLRDYIEMLHQGGDPVTSAQTAFGDLEQLQKKLNTYINKATFTTVRVKTAILYDPKTLKSESVPVSEIEALRGDVLLRGDRQKEAQPLLEAALQDDPKSLLAHEAMGLLMFQKNKFPEAVKWYGEAIDLGSQSYTVNANYGNLAMRIEDKNDDSKIEASQRAAIRINPNFPVSYDTLAELYSKRNIKLDEAHILELQAMDIDPHEVMYWLHNAEILVQQDRYKDAINGLKLGLGKVTEAKEKARIQSKIDEYQAVLDKKNQPPAK